MYPEKFVFAGLTLPRGPHDKRRAIYELNLGKTGSVQYFIVSPDAGKDVILGEHYHTKMEAEVFIIEQGGGMLYTRLLDEQGQPVAGKTEHPLKTGDRVVIPRLTAHTFVMKPGSEMSCVRTRPWDEKVPDMHKHSLA